MSSGRVLQHNSPMVRANQARRNAPTKGRRNVKLGRSPGWNLVRAERSRLCIYAYVEKGHEDQGVNRWKDANVNTCGFDSKHPRFISSVSRVDEYMRSPTSMELRLSPGESRGYWKYHTPGK